MSRAVIIDAVRSPIGKGKVGGVFSGLHAVDLLAQVLAGLVIRNDLDPGMVDDIIIGCVSQAGEQAATPGRMAWLAAGYPAHVPSTTIDRRCGSSQQAVHFAAHGIAAGEYDIVIAGGVESMSRVPMGSARMGQDPFGPSVTARYAPGLVSQGIAAELVAARWNISREEQDIYALASQQRAAAASANGEFSREIVPIVVPSEDGEVVVSTDESIRPDTTLEGLAALRPAFVDEGMAARFPEIRWSVTAGNSSQITDGASAVLMMSEDRASSLGLQPRASFRSFAVCGDDPILMLTGPIPATERALKHAGVGIDEIDCYEVNEAFAPVPLCWAKEFGADAERLNVRGGAIALGHPLGASGTRLMTAMLSTLEDTGGRLGLQTMCEAGGMANATLIERL